ncbi:phosphoesterase [Aeromonas phage D3]|uniref:Putative serine/threonine protein phosphatase n=1 Tax=Aeromonas phage D3 TaxID=2593327 RepID=A0A514TV59_9CAUD|nr:phosphoesterase [Aeromonas phage D3]QDJ96919.1 putative serine/threonine protein phosphatase [Aeromonas phage D3]
MQIRKQFDPNNLPEDINSIYDQSRYIPKRSGGPNTPNEWFWSDLHIDHLPALKARGWFGALQEYQDYVAFIWDTHVKDIDTIHLVGDIALTWQGLRWISERTGKKILYMGNHDTERENCIRDLLSVYDDIRGFWKHKKGFYIGHCPSHPSELRGRRMIHGHTHTKVIQDQRFINVAIDLLPNGPVNMKDLVSGDYRSYRDPA